MHPESEIWKNILGFCLTKIACSIKLSEYDELQIELHKKNESIKYNANQSCRVLALTTTTRFFKPIKEIKSTRAL